MKMLVLSAACVGAALFATMTEHAGSHAATPAPVEASEPERTVIHDPDSELRAWLREPQPPTF